MGSSAGAFAFIIQDSTIGGDLKFEKNQGPTVIGSGGPGGGNTIGGDLQIFDNNVEGVFCPPDAPPEECPFFEDGHFNDNIVGGNMQLFKNHGPTEVIGNTIEANLQCKENEPPPVGDGNTAKQKEEQCAAL